MRRRKRSLGSTRHAAIFSPPLGRAQPIGMKKGTPVPPRPAPLRQSVLTFRSCVAQEFADRISKRWPSTLSPIKKLQSGGMKKKNAFSHHYLSSLAPTHHSVLPGRFWLVLFESVGLVFDWQEVVVPCTVIAYTILKLWEPWLTLLESFRKAFGQTHGTRAFKCSYLVVSSI